VETFTANAVFPGKVKNFSNKIHSARKAITVKFIVRENTTRKELHPLELTSKHGWRNLFQSGGAQVHVKKL